jgi:hypothetical protein
MSWRWDNRQHIENREQVKLKWFLILLIPVLASCKRYEAHELYGIYTPDNYVNSFDTVELKSGNVYVRKIYNKDDKLVLQTTGRWELKNGAHILFADFYLNLDQDLKMFPELINEKAAYDMDVVIEKAGGQLGFCTGYYINTNCYHKR